MNNNKLNNDQSPDKILEEIKEEVRYEKIVSFFKSYQKQLSSVLTAAIVIVAIFLFWQYRQKDILEESSHDLTNAIYFMGSKKDKKAMEIIDTIPQKSGNAYSDLAKLLAGSLLASQEEHEAAIESYQQLVKSASYDELEDLGRLRLIYATLDTADKDTLLKALAVFIQNKNSVWRFVAREMEGFVYLREKDYTTASEIFQTLLKEKNLAETQKLRIELVLSYLNAKG